MSSNSIEKLKQAQSSLISERKPVPQIQDALNQAKEITQFVHIALNKENRWIFQPGEQESIVSMLSEINKTSKELYEKCRTPEHFNREIGRFLIMKNDIFRKSNCIHLSLDQGFYGTEPLGLSPIKAVEISLKKIKTLHEGLSQGKWVLSPIETNIDDPTKKEVEKLFSESVSISDKIFKKDNFKSFEPPLTIEETQILYKFFQVVKSILDLEKQVILNSLTKQSVSKNVSTQEILENLSKFEKNINDIKLPGSNIIPNWGIELYKISLTDIQLRMHLLRIPFEPIAFQKKRFNKLKKQGELDGIEKSVTDIQINSIQELEQLQLFIETFGEIDRTFREVSGILQNLSISFGKIYHNASSQTISSNFLIKVLGLINGMLEKGLSVAKSKTKKLGDLQKKVDDIELFDPPIIKGILYAIELLDQGKDEINQYCERINSYIEIISNESDWDSMKTYKFLQKAYEESTNLTSAAMIFGSVTKTSTLLKSSIEEVKSILKEIIALKEKNHESNILYNEALDILGKEKDFSQESLKKSSEQIEELNWLLEEMLGENVQEEQRFLNELRIEIKPVIARIQAKKLITSSETQSEEKKLEQKSHYKKIVRHQPKKSPKSEQKEPLSKKSIYDPFEPFEMVAIKNACKNMTSPEGKMIYHVLTNTHTFFTLLNKMENSFKPGEGLENELIQDLEKSKTTHEFLNNFARLKFLPHGYYSNNNVPFNYDEKKRMFVIPAGIEKQLKLSETSIGSPMEVYRRLIRVILGFDEPKTLSTIMPMQVLSILEEDFMLKIKDRRLVEEKLQST